MGALLYERFDPVTGRYTEIETDAEAGLLITHSQDTRPIVESARTIAANFDPLVRRDTIHVARIPVVIWRQLQKLGIAQDEKRLNAWLNERDNSVFRTDDRSVL
ncbi:MAG TPA: hypothetical protein VN903_21070 [Polyangia bacterium]|nr:hypothetical protein [Polyangia bacterium]HXU03477.1 hypothetical protein [Polyangia bacterium]